MELISKEEVEKEKRGGGTNAVNGDACCDPFLDVGDYACGDFGVAGGVEVVVVDVELRIGVGGSGSLEGDGDKVLAENIIEDRGAHATVLVEDLVHDVPSVDLALVAGNEGCHVVLEDGLKKSFVRRQ